MREYADTIRYNGILYTLDDEGTIYSAIAEKNGKILYLGSNDDCAAFAGPATVLCDLNGRTVFPSFTDAHVHAPGLAYDILFNVDLFGTTTAEDALTLVKAHIEAHPNYERYYGRGFSAAGFTKPEQIKGPRKERLDALCADKPIILADFGGNYLWLNSKAFEYYGITPETACPPDGCIELDEETGALWGVLREGARRLVPYQHFSEEQTYEAAVFFQRKLLSYGYTNIRALRPPGTVEPRTTCFELFQALERRGELALRVRGARDMSFADDIEAQLSEMKRVKNEVDSELICFDTAKFFIDGVVDCATALLLEPYTEKAGKGADYAGLSPWSEETLSLMLRRCLEEGFHVHCHTIGDGAVRLALNALESAYRAMDGAEAERAHGRVSFTHLQLVSAEDKIRMARLGVVAVVQPYWHFKDPHIWEPLEYSMIGERAEGEYPLQSLLDEGVCVVSSSDHPVTPDPNPFVAMQIGVTRCAAGSEISGDAERTLLGKNERVSLAAMLASFTRNAAYERGAETEGMLKAGYSADLVITDRDPMKLVPERLHEVRVTETVFRGRTVYTSEQY